MTVDEAKLEQSLNIDALKECIAELNSIVRDTVQKNRERARSVSRRGKLPNFSEGDYVLMAREEFFAGEELALRWRGPRRIVKAVNDYVYQVEDLRTGLSEEVHGSRLKFYHDPSLDTEAVLSHVLSSETGMVVARLLRLEEHEDGLYVVVRWKGLPNSEDSVEPLEKVYEDVPRMLERLLARKNTPSGLAAKARSILSL